MDVHGIVRGEKLEPPHVGCYGSAGKFGEQDSPYSRSQRRQKCRRSGRNHDTLVVVTLRSSTTPFRGRAAVALSARPSSGSAHEELRLTK